MSGPEPEPEPYVRPQTVSQSFEEAKLYTVNGSNVNNENEKMGAKIEETAFSERNKLTRNKEKQYKTYLEWKLGCDDVRIHNWKLVDLSNEYKEKTRSQQNEYKEKTRSQQNEYKENTRSKLDDQLPDVIVEFSCKGYFHNKFNISYNEIKDNKDILEVMYSVYEYDQLDLNITDKEILKEQIKKTRLWIKTKEKELQTTKDNEELRNKLEKAKQALADAEKLVQGPKQVMKPHSRDALPQFKAAGIEKPIREAFTEQFGDNEINTTNNNLAYVNKIELNVADPFDYLRWWYQQYENMSKLEIMEGIVNGRKPKQAKEFQRKIGYKFKVLKDAFKEARETLNPNEDPIIRLFDTTNLNMNSDDFGTPINKRTMGELFTLKYKGVFYYVMVDAENNIEIRLATYLNKEAKEAAEIEAREEYELEEELKKQLAEASDSDKDYKTEDNESYDSDSSDMSL